MKRNTDNISKFTNLKTRLRITRFEAVGILECLWHMTARETPQGDIGRRTNKDIATYIEWPREPDELINALIAERWLDAHPLHRLIVHGWPEHCEDSIHMALARKVMLFADGTIPNMKRLSKEERERLLPALLALKDQDSRRFATEVKNLTPLLGDLSVRTDSESVRTNLQSVRTESVRTTLPCPALPEPSLAKPLPGPAGDQPDQPAQRLLRATENSNSQPARKTATEKLISTVGKTEPEKLEVTDPDKNWTVFEKLMLDFGISTADVQSISDKAKSLFTEFKLRPEKRFICHALGLAFKSKRDPKVQSIPAVVCAWLIKVAKTKNPPYEPPDYYTKLAEQNYDRLIGGAMS